MSAMHPTRTHSCVPCGCLQGGLDRVHQRMRGKGSTTACAFTIASDGCSACAVSLVRAWAMWME